MMQRNRGITLLEMIFTITLIVFLVSSVLAIYIVCLQGWNNLGHQTDIHEKVHFGLERMIRDARESPSLVVANHSLRFQNGATGYIYYLYNSSDTWVPAYNQSSYELRKATLTTAGSAGIADDTFTYGSGDVVATGIMPPPQTSITASGNIALITLKGQQGTDSLSVRGYVRPRNI